MRGLYIAGAFVVSASLIATAGCGGGGGGSSASHAIPNASSKNQYTIRVKIPSASASSSSAVRRVKYVSASVQSIVVQILGNGGTQLVQGADYVNVTANGSSGAGSCTTVSGTTTCTLGLSAAIGSGGTFTLVVATYDAQQAQTCAPSGTPACSGNLLSISDMPQNIAAGQTTSVTLGGVPAYIQGIELVSGYMIAHNNAITLYGPGPQKIDFEFLDADLNAIIGPGAPQVSVTAANPSVLAGSISTVANSGVYTVTFNPVTTTVSGQPVIQPGTAALQFSVAIPNTSLTESASLSVTLAHSALYVSGLSVPNPGTDTIYAYFDGNTAPTGYTSFYDTGYVPLNIVTDINGNVWAADYGNNKVAFWNNPQPGSVAPDENDPTGPFSYPFAIAFDISGNAFLGNCPSCAYQSGNYSLTQYNAPSPQSAPNFTTVVYTNYSDMVTQPMYLAVDANDHIYLSTYNTSTTHSGAVEYNPGSMVSTTLIAPGPNGVNGLAVDPIHGYVWANTAVPDAVEINPSNMTVQLTIPAANNNDGIATDSLGNVFIANVSGTGIFEYSPPSFSSATTIGSVNTPVSVAVYPNSLIGQYSPIGVVPPQLPSPIPIPAPT
jgi:hypothetical protein